MFPWLLLAASLITDAGLEKTLDGRPGAIVVIESPSGLTFRSNTAACAEKLPPCSTFKIWNTAIGLEVGLVTDPDAPFWKWDGQKRFIDGWNADQTLRSAFTVSCVPAYQELARKIGESRMTEWLAKIGYGDRDISSGLDVFWLDAEGRKSLLISPDDQAALIHDLVQGKTPFSASTLATLKDVMRAVQTERGTLYGKTGTGELGNGQNFAWYVGYLESGTSTYAFAALLKGPNLTGKDTRTMMEKYFRSLNLL